LISRTIPFLIIAAILLTVFILSERLYSMRGLISMKMGKPEQAAELFLRTIERDPDNAYAYYHRARALRQVNRLDQAAGAAEAVVRLMPEFADAYALLSDIRRIKGDHEAAVTAGEMAVKYSSSNSHFHYLHGLALLSAGRPGRAAAAFAQALALEPDNPYARYKLGMAYMRQNLHYQAVRQFSMAVRQKPDDPFFQYDLGRAHAAAGNVEMAERALSESVRINPDYYYARYELGRISLRLEKIDAARRQFEEALRIDPNLPHARDALNSMKKTEENQSNDEAVRKNNSLSK
jgi:tetratricopeptide (TPR) repeat protein